MSSYLRLAIRGVLARRPVRYAFTHPVLLVSVVFPSVRVIFSFRLVRSVFRRGHLGRFLVAAAVLVLNGAVIVYLFERHAPKSSIHTLGESLWWSVVTVTASPKDTKTTGVLVFSGGTRVTTTITAHCGGQGSPGNRGRGRRARAAQQQRAGPRSRGVSGQDYTEGAAVWYAAVAGADRAAAGSGTARARSSACCALTSACFASTSACQRVSKNHIGIPAQQQTNNSASGMFSQNHVPTRYPP